MAATMFLCCFFSKDSDSFFCDFFSFFSAYLRSPKGVASIIPSSGPLSRAMVAHIQFDGAPLLLLEIGAGTGPITAELVKKLRPEDMLDVIEIDEALCDVLRKKFGHLPNVRIHCLSLLDWHPEYQYDYVVSALPHNTFGIDFVSQVLKQYRNFVKPDGTISYVELRFFGAAKDIFLWGEKRVARQEVKCAMEAFKNQFYVDCKSAFNIPPAWVFHLRNTKESQ